MKMAKRIMCGLLVALMCMSLLPSSAFASPQKNGSITLTVKDSLTGEPVNGASIRLDVLDENEVKGSTVKKTGNDGKVTWTELGSGWYRIAQVSVPDGYFLDQNVIVDYYDFGENTKASVEMTNRVKNALYIFRIDETTGEALAGARYEISKKDGNKVTSGTTDKNGCLVIPQMAAGEYVITEKSVPSGHQVSKDTQSVAINTNSSVPAVVVFTDAKSSSVVVFNYDMATGKPIAGSKWTVTDENGEAVLEDAVTMDNGLVVVPNVEAGTYNIKEQEVAEGFKSDIREKTVTIGDTVETNVSVLNNTHEGSITVFVGDHRDGSAVKGALCELRNLNGQLVSGPSYTDGNGVVTFDNVDDGTYSVRVVPPDTYKIALAVETIVVYGGGEYKTSVPVTGKGVIEISVFDAKTKEALPKAEVLVSKANGTEVGTYTTDAEGKIRVTGLDAGTYFIKETKAPAGYVLNDIEQSVIVKQGEVVKVSIDHYNTPHILVHCYVRGTATPVVGSVVTLVKMSNNETVVGTISEDGSCMFENLTTGKYLVKYTSAPEGYSIYTVSQQAEVTSTSSPSVTLYATLDSSITIKKVDTETGLPLPGAVFSILDAAGSTVDVVTTDSTGSAVSKALTAGNYTVYETTPPEGYVPATEYQTVTVSEGAQVELTFTNRRAASIVVYAYTDSEDPLAGVTYILYNAVTGEDVASAVTNLAGIAVFADVTPGAYTVVESVIPDGYTVVDPTQSNVNVAVGSPTYLRFVHVPLSTITIQTVDILTGEGIGGAEYLIVSEDGSYRMNVTADENGDIVTDAMPMGTYLVKQVTAPEGYMLNTTTQTVTLYRDYSALAKFFNRPMSGILVETVVSGSDFGLPGVVVTIENEQGKEVARGTTLDDGTWQIPDIEPGIYTVKVINMPKGYECVQKERSAEVTTGVATSVKFEFIGDRRLVVNLTDRDDPAKGLAGAKFRVESVSGEFVTEIVTDVSGKATTGFIPNGTYTVHEIVAPEGYLLDQSYQWVEVTENADAVLDFTNARISGLVLQALNEADGTGIAGAKFEIWAQNDKLVKTVVTDKTGVATVDGLEPGTYLVKETVTPDGYTARTLSQTVEIASGDYATLNFNHTVEATVVIKAIEDDTSTPIAGARFIVTKADGSYVGEYSTDKSGTVTISHLAAGTYNIYESYVPDGYVIDSVSRSFNVVDGQTTVVTYRNELLSGICVRFYDAATGSPIYGVTMEVRDKNNNYVGRYTSNNRGEVDLTDVLDAGRYVLAMLTAPSPYEMDNIPKTIDLTEGHTATIKWALYKTPGQITITTYSGEDSAMMNVRKNSTLPGAVYNIYNSNGVLVNTIVGDSTGCAYSGMLSAGTYYIQQVTAPAGWQLNAARVAVNLSAANNNVRIEVYNKAANYETYVGVYGPGSAIAGNTASFYYTVENKSTCAMNNFFLHIKVPTDVMRTCEFHTGTYTGSATTYYLEYKTNMNDYRILASGLNSKSNYGYDLSSQSLGLQAGEYVTDIRMVFATAVSGFKQSMAPTLDCYVLTTVTMNTQATMRADVGGMIGSYSDYSNGGQFGTNTGSGINSATGWTSGSSEFTLWIIGIAQNPLPGRLPQTGY